MKLYEGWEHNLILLALTRGADATTIKLMLDFNFTIPKYGLHAHCKGFNSEALVVLYEYVVNRLLAPAD